MELTNENNLIENQICTISYSGFLFQNNSEEVTIVYGFGDNWENTSEKLMTKTENGFKVEIKMLNFDKFNFCFRNSNYEWDNNNYANYSLPIEKEEISQIETSSILENNKDALLNDIIQDSRLELNYIQEFNIDKLIDDLLRPLLTEEVSEFEEEETEINENVTTMLNEELSNENQVQNIETEADTDLNSSVNFIEEKEPENDYSRDSLDELKRLAENIKTSTEIHLDQVTSELENDIISEDLFANAPVSDSKALTVQNEDKFVVCSRSLSKFYMLRKKIKLAFCKVVFAIPRMINKQLNTDKNK